MSTIVDCPSCSRKLRVPEELLGKKVKCPTCSGTFDAVAAPEPARTPAPSSPIAPPFDPRLELVNEGQVRSGAEDTSPAPTTPSETPAGSVPVSEQETLTHLGSEPSVDQDLTSCPYCGEKITKEATRCQFCGEELGEEDKGADRPWDKDYRPYRDVRRDSEPHRATLILTLGIVSIVTSVTWFLGIIGLILGLCAWVMGQRDLRKMRANVMDPQGLGTTQAGWICGIIGTAFGGLMSLCCLAYVGWIVIMMTSMSRMTPATPTVAPRPAGPVVRPAPAPAPAQKKMEKMAPAPGAPAPAPAKKDE